MILYIDLRVCVWFSSEILSFLASKGERDATASGGLPQSGASCPERCADRPGVPQTERSMKKGPASETLR